MSGATKRELVSSSGLDSILYLLSNRHRRLILFALRPGENKTESDLLFRGPDETEEIEMDLVHNHLPKLEEAGYIEWDREAGEVSKGPRYEEIEPLLDLIESHADELPPDWP